MDRQSQYIQGYRVLYRQTSGLPSPGPWQSQDVKVPSERSMVLAQLKKGIVYEIKVRPYFNEFQGMDSESRTARTTEEGEASWESKSFLLLLYSLSLPGWLFFSLFSLTLCTNVQCPHRFSVVICDPSHPPACEHTKYCHVRTVAPDSPLTGHDTARTLPCCCFFFVFFYRRGEIC